MLDCSLQTIHLDFGAASLDPSEAVSAMRPVQKNTPMNSREDDEGCARMPSNTECRLLLRDETD